MNKIITSVLLGLTLAVMSDYSASDTGYKAEMIPDTFELTDDASVYQERKNEDGTITAISITQNGDVIVTVKGFSYIGEIRNQELVWTRNRP